MNLGERRRARFSHWHRQRCPTPNSCHYILIELGQSPPTTGQGATIDPSLAS